MRYIKQRGGECFLTAICQVVPSLDIKEERKLYLTKGGYVTREQSLKWVEIRFPEVFVTVVCLSYGGGWPIKVSEQVLKGKGIILIQDYRYSKRHAVSFEKGQILDSAHGGKVESLEDFKQRIEDWFIEGIIPIVRE